MEEDYVVSPLVFPNLELAAAQRETPSPFPKRFLHRRCHVANGIEPWAWAKALLSEQAQPGELRRFFYRSVSNSVEGTPGSEPGIFAGNSVAMGVLRGPRSAREMRKCFRLRGMYE